MFTILVLITNNLKYLIVSSYGVLIIILLMIVIALLFSGVLMSPINAAIKSNITTLVESIANQQINDLSQNNNDISFPSKILNGTLKIGNSDVPITYEKRGNFSYFENDIILTNEKSNGRIAIDKFIKAKPWTNGIIPVAIDPATPNKKDILQAIAYVANTTAIKFKPLTVVENIIRDPNYILFVPGGNSCASKIGMTGGLQTIQVADWCKKGGIIHELSHALGLWHEQTRCDRDDYIQVVWDNIPDNFKHNFVTICDPIDPFKLPLSPISYGEYDYCSIMHYPESAAQSIDQSKPILIPKMAVIGCDHIGQTDGYSEKDLNGINFIYPEIEFMG